MTEHQEIAIRNHCRLASETMHTRHRRIIGDISVILTVNSGYE